MRVKVSAIGIMLVAGLAFGQAKPAPKAAAASAKKTATAPVKKTTAATMPSPMKPKPHAIVHKAKPTAPAAAPAAPATTAEAAVPGTAAPELNRKRDPFVNPIQAVREGRNGACSGGKRCLAANEIVLRGVVKSVNGMIAVVENSAQRTYFLRVKDAIYNGYVQQITPDSLILREHYLDNLGHDSERDIVKTVNAPVV